MIQKIKIITRIILKQLPGIVIGIILVFIGFYVTNKLQSGIDLQKIESAKPIVNFRINELKPGQLNVEFQSTNVSGNIIDKLFFKFEIPGTYNGHKIRHKDKIGSLNIKNTMSSGSAGIITSENIIIEVEKIYPSGFLEFVIYYKSTEYINQVHKHIRYWYTPLMDLHDYMPYYYFWTYAGNELTEQGEVALSHLNYIIKDNNNLIQSTNFLKWSIVDQINERPDHPITKYLIEIDQSTIKDIIEIPYSRYPFSVDTLFIDQDSILLKSIRNTFLGLYDEYNDVLEMEEQRKKWY